MLFPNHKEHSYEGNISTWFYDSKVNDSLEKVSLNATSQQDSLRKAIIYCKGIELNATDVGDPRGSPAAGERFSNDLLPNSPLVEGNAAARQRHGSWTTKASVATAVPW